MNLKIYNSLSNQKEDFKPIKDNCVSVYVCGLTVYDLPHLGHAKLYIVFDVIIRYLRYVGYDVTYIRNITDIDDKIINKSLEQNVEVKTLADKYTNEMQADFNNLGLINPDIEPKATEHLEQIINIIKTLIEKKYAYVADSGDVYFDVSSYEKYGLLSSRDLKGQAAGKRVDVTEDKKNAEDFVLWKSYKEGEPFWGSPWGDGRPGWHIECSAMSMHYLGDYFDIHGGGYDLIFPHHENEIAQSCAATEKEFVKYWMHVGYLKLNDEKMSKSTGNFCTIRDLLSQYHPESIRMFLVSSHYRSQQNFTRELIAEADSSLLRLYNALIGLDIEKTKKNEDGIYKNAFIEAMNDDFNTSKASAVLFEIAHEIERNKKTDIKKASELANILIELSDVFGILQEDPKNFLQHGYSSNEKNNINYLITKRAEARENKDWELADKLRKELESMNIHIEDGIENTIWRRKATI